MHYCNKIMYLQNNVLTPSLNSLLTARKKSGAEPAQSRCGEAAKALDALGLRRMVVGHTPQITAGINACCGGRVYRIDTGLSSFYGGMKQCLEVERGARPRVISSTPEYFW